MKSFREFFEEQSKQEKAPHFKKAELTPKLFTKKTNTSTDEYAEKTPLEKEHEKKRPAALEREKIKKPDAKKTKKSLDLVPAT